MVWITGRPKIYYGLDDDKINVIQKVFIVIVLINLNKSSKSSYYPYPEDPKLPKDILLTGTTLELFFEYYNVIDFWLIGFVSIVTKVTSKKNYVGWIRNDPRVWYSHLCISILILILNYYRMSIGMPQGELYKLIVTIIIHSVLTFDIINSINRTWKSILLYYKSQLPLISNSFKAYMGIAEITSKIPLTSK